VIAENGPKLTEIQRRSSTQAGDIGAPSHVTDDVGQGDLAGAALEAVFKLKL
jgi:hypothetical protein